jgi:ArsR family transcriptional regulator
MARVPANPRQAARRRSEIDRAMDVEFFRALSDPTRASLLACLVKCGRRCAVSGVAECCAVDFSVVARHLATFARAGLVEALKEGRTVWYSARCDDICGRLRTLADAVDHWRAACDAMQCGCDDAKGGACGC